MYICRTNIIVMIEKIGNIIVIGLPVENEKCTYCGVIDELRPYGRNNAMICYDCGMKPENKSITNKKTIMALNGGRKR